MNIFEGFVLKDNSLMYIRNYNKYISLEQKDFNNKEYNFEISDNFFKYNHIVLSNTKEDIYEFLYGNIAKTLNKFRNQVFKYLKRG